MIRSSPPRILVISPDLSETSSWYRAAGPLSYLQKQGVCELTFISPRESIAWPTIMRHDIMLILRPAFPDYVKICSIAKGLGIKIWVDHDDNILELPYSHPEWNYFTSDPVRDAIRDCLKMADIVTVTTEELKTSLSKLRNINAEIRVIPNAVDDYLFPAPKSPPSPKNKLIAWRGGNSHAADLEILKPHTLKLVESGFRFVFFGMKPSSLEKVLPVGSFSHIPWDGDICAFFGKLRKLNATFHVVPLEENALNMSKSNIAWQESTWHGGSVCVASEIGSREWECALRTNNFENVIPQTFDIQSDPMVKSSQHEIITNYLLSNVNKKRIQVIEDLMKG